MSGPRLVGELLQAWSRGLPLEESRSLQMVLAAIARSLELARSSPASLDRRCIALAITKLEEAEHWALAAMRAAVDRHDEERPEPSE